MFESSARILLIDIIYHYKTQKLESLQRREGSAPMTPPFSCLRHSPRRLRRLVLPYRVRVRDAASAVEQAFLRLHRFLLDSLTLQHCSGKPICI